MADVRIAFIKRHELSNGDVYSPGQVIVANEGLAERFVGKGVAVYYSDFTSALIEQEAEAVADEEKPKGKKAKGE